MLLFSSFVLYFVLYSRLSFSRATVKAAQCKQPSNSGNQILVISEPAGGGIL